METKNKLPLGNRKAAQDWKPFLHVVLLSIIAVLLYLLFNSLNSIAEIADQQTSGGSQGRIQYLDLCNLFQAIALSMFSSDIVNFCCAFMLSVSLIPLFPSCNFKLVILTALGAFICFALIIVDFFLGQLIFFNGMREVSSFFPRWGWLFAQIAPCMLAFLTAIWGFVRRARSQCY